MCLVLLLGLGFLIHLFGEFMRGLLQSFHRRFDRFVVLALERGFDCCDGVLDGEGWRGLVLERARAL